MRVSDSIWFCEKGFSGLCTIEAEVDVVNEELEVEVAIVLVISRKSRRESPPATHKNILFERRRLLSHTSSPNGHIRLGWCPNFLSYR